MNGIDWITETAKQVPALCVLAWVVKVFLSHLRSINKQHSDITVEWRKAIERNSEILGSVREVIRQCSVGRD